MTPALMPLTGEGTPFEQVLERGNVLEPYRDFYGTLWDEKVLQPALLELLRLRVAQLHGCAAELAIRELGSTVDDETLAALASWRDADRFTPLERAALEYTDLIPWGHHQITDEQVEAIKAEIGEDGFVALSIAVAFFDANCRLRLVFEMPPSVTEPVPAPASRVGTLY